MSLHLCRLRFIYVDIEKTVWKRPQVWDRCSLEYFVLIRFYLRGLTKKVWREFHFNKTIILRSFTQNTSSKHSERLSTQQHCSNLHKHHFGDFGLKLFWILTVVSISLGNCRFYCPRSFQSIEGLYKLMVIFLKCMFEKRVQNSLLRKELLASNFTWFRGKLIEYFLLS